MTRQALVVHLMLKDFRLVRGWLALAWLASLSLAVGKLASDALLGREQVHQVAVVVVLVIAQAALFLLDPPLGTTAFWMTRPIPRHTLLTAKLALWLVALVVPCVLLELAPMALMGLGLIVPDYALAAADGVLWSLALGPAFLVVTLAIQRPATRAAVGLAAGITLLLNAAPFTWSFGGPSPGDVAWVTSPRPLVATRWALSCALLALAGLAALRALYVTRRWVASAGVLCAGLALSGAARQLWPWETVEPLAMAYRSWRGVAKDRTPASRLAGLRVTLSRLRNVGYLDNASRFRQELRARAEATFTGRPADVSLLQVGYRATLRRDGAADESVAADDGRWAWPYDDPTPRTRPDPFQVGDDHLPPWRAVALGCGLTDPGAYNVEFWRSALDRAPPQQEVRGRLSGHVSIRATRPFVAGRVPLRNGSVLELGRQRVIVDLGGEGSQRTHPWLSLTLETMALRLLAEPGLPDYQLQIFNPSRGDCAAASMGIVGSSGYPPGVTLRRHRGNVDLGYPTPSREWLEQAELVALSAEELGRMEVPFELGAVSFWR